MPAVTSAVDCIKTKKAWRMFNCTQKEVLVELAYNTYLDTKSIKIARSNRTAYQFSSRISLEKIYRFWRQKGDQIYRYPETWYPYLLTVVAAIIIIIRVHEVTSNVISNTQVAGKRKVCLCKVCMALTTTQILVTNCIDSIFQDQCVVEMLTAPELESYLAGYWKIFKNRIGARFQIHESAWSGSYPYSNRHDFRVLQQI